MTKENKIKVALDYISKHKDNNIFDWHPMGSDDDKKLLAVYSRLERGAYGFVYDSPDNEGGFEIEISSEESHTGNLIIFEWEI